MPNNCLNLVEKIATKYARDLKNNQPARQGDFITICPQHIMTHDNTSAVMAKFKTIGTPKIHNPQQPIFAIDHDIQNTSPENLTKYAKIAQFARQHKIDFYPAGSGISHQIIIENGYATPGSLVVGSDSHSNIYGAVNALGTPVVRTDAACIWATGSTWWKVPDVARVTLTGQLKPGVVGKDVIIALCGLFNNDEILNMAIEFTGDGLASLSLDQRMSIANMTTEWGALAGIFPFDNILKNYLYSRAEIFIKQGDNPPKYTKTDIDNWYNQKLEPDENAYYPIDITLDLATVIPHVSGPDHVKVMHSLPEMESKKIKVHKAYILSCVNGRLEDLTEAAKVLEGKTVASHVKLYVAAASAEIQQAAIQNGTWKILINAGAIMLPPGCGTCIGMGQGTLEPGEIGISATNRNFKGRMGSRDAVAYLASPAVVAASAVIGYICSPVEFTNTKPVSSLKTNPAPTPPKIEVDIIDGFPAATTGRVLWLPVDNLNTDGIYSGVMTYKDNVTDEEMASAAMQNYDPGFQAVAQPKDIIVSGKNFGTGSSREQAATCIAKKGIQCVIACSFSETYARNAFNNGFIVIACPQLSDYLRHKYANSPKAATIIGPELTINYRNSTITCEGNEYSFPPLSITAQKLIVDGGAENVARNSL